MTASLTRPHTVMEQGDSPWREGSLNNKGNIGIAHEDKMEQNPFIKDIRMYPIHLEMFVRNNIFTRKLT